jgi:hypothetical protein
MVNYKPIKNSVTNGTNGNYCLYSSGCNETITCSDYSGTIPIIPVISPKSSRLSNSIKLGSVWFLIFLIFLFLY